jgi:dihydrofolate reductase
MGRTIMGAIVSLDGFMADDDDGVGPLFDWLGNGDVTWSFPGSDSEVQTTQASADFMLDVYGDMAANVIGRRVFDMTDGWNGTPAAGEHVFVVTHQPPTDWEHADTAPFTFVDGVEKAIAPADRPHQSRRRFVGLSPIKCLLAGLRDNRARAPAARGSQLGRPAR